MNGEGRWLSPIFTQDTMTPIPTQAQELERKTVEEIERLLRQCDAGHITKNNMAMAAHSIWNVTAGLVDADTSRLAEQAAMELQFTNQVIRRRFLCPSGIVEVSYHPEKPGYLVRSIDASTKEVKVLKASRLAPGDRDAELAKVINSLAPPKYLELT